jgi:pyruvate formate lyase activating enzyme
MKTVREKLDALSKAAWLSETLADEVVRCQACAHRCHIQPGRRGICQMRYNREGQLYAPWGYVAAANVDPIEKKPFMHFLPGSAALTFGMLGCNFHCDFCQNWVSSQTLRDPAADGSINYIQPISPQELIDYGVRHGAQVVASSYNEPLITTEWAVEIFKAAKEKGLRCVYVSNGYATPEALQALAPYLDGYKIDLKCWSDTRYRELGGSLQVVLDTIRRAHDLGMWVEVVTLVIPGFNDSNEDLWESARYLASVSVDIPWHVTAFHPMYKRLDGQRTETTTLQRAAEIGQEAGLRYVYAGNLPGRVGSLEDTHCPACGRLLVQRAGFSVLANHISAQGTCPDCGQEIAGVWS